MLTAPSDGPVASCPMAVYQHLSQAHYAGGGCVQPETQSSCALICWQQWLPSGVVRNPQD